MRFTITRYMRAILRDGESGGGGGQQGAGQGNAGAPGTSAPPANGMGGGGHPATPPGQQGAGQQGGTGGGQGTGSGAGQGGQGGQQGQGGGAGTTGPPEGWQPPTYDEWVAQQNAVATANRKRTEAERRANGQGTGSGSGGGTGSGSGSGSGQQGQGGEQAPPADDRAARLEQRLIANAVGGAVQSVAQQLGFRNPELAARLVSTSGIDAAVDPDTDEVTLTDAHRHELRQRLEREVQANPYLVEPRPGAQLSSAGSASQGRAEGGNQAMNDIIRRAAGRGQ